MNRLSHSLLMVILAVVTTAANDAFDGSHSSVGVNYELTSDESFTEPVESIEVACAESGIVRQVHVQRGDRVVRDDLLLELDTSVLEASRKLAEAKAGSTAKLNAAQVEFEQKSDRFAKLEALYRDQAGSPDEVQRARSDMLISQENVQAIREELQQHELELRRIEFQLEQRRVRSPIDGIVVDLTRKPGEFVSVNDPRVATIVRLDTLKAVFYVPTDVASRFRQGGSVFIELIESRQVAPATIQYIAPVTSADSGRVRMDVLIENQLGRYRSGVRCRIAENTIRTSSRHIENPMIRVNQ